MKKPTNSKWKIAASLALAASFALAHTASAALVITTANENNAGAFTPSWTVATGAANLIAGLSPASSSGNYTLEGAGGLARLTDGAIGPIGGTLNTYATGGNGGGAGNEVVYTLPASANGYNLTNITVFSGWNDAGRDAQGYTVLYSTVANPGNFIYLTSVGYNPSVPGGRPSSNRSIIDDPSAGVFAANVGAIKFVLHLPGVENGYVGYSEITVGGTAALSVVSPVVSITTANQNNPSVFTPSWTPETPNLIALVSPSTAAGNFTQESSGGTPILTDGVLGESGTIGGFATCGTGGGNTLIYTLTNVVNGTDVTNIVLYSGWGNANRDAQYFTISYATIAAPSSYIPITTVYYNPLNVPGASANRVSIALDNGASLASGVANLKFDFGSPAFANQVDNAYSGFSEIIVQGTDTATPPPPPSPILTQDTLPVRAETFVGDQVVFTADYSNAPPANLQWQFVNTAGTVTNDLLGATTATLTLNNVQLTDSGNYQLKAVNATNGAAAPSYSTAAALAVSMPTTVGNVVAKNTGQAGPATFYPAWTIDTNVDLIFGFPTDGSGNPGTAAAGAGNFGLEVPLSGDPTLLADGVLSSDRTQMVGCGWVNVSAGQSMTYTLPAGPSFGYEITNITVYGGWPDNGRNQQKYQVLYSTFSAPATFVSIGTFDYNPSFSVTAPNSTRVILVPLTGVLAHNVAAVRINFNMQSKNNWNGYSEITIGGTPSLGVIPVLTQDITPLTAQDVVGSSLTLAGDFSGATSYQWQKDGTNLPGATAITLTLNNLQLSDTATNGGYRLLGINVAGTNATRGCSVIVDPVPAATNNVITAFAYQSSDVGAANPFGPTWDTSSLSASLIAGQNPPSGGFGPGNFNDPDVNFPGSAGGLPALTDNGYGVFAFDGSHPAFATAGPNAGQYVIYTLGADPNGYSITNIQIAGGWNDNGRNSQYYTVSYSTIASPASFLPIKAVQHSPSFPSENVIRATITPATGVLASNAYAIKVDFTIPGGVPNAYSGYSEISVYGSPSPNPDSGPLVTAENQLNATTWTVETPNLIANQLPSSQGPGVFTLEGCNVTNLTDGVIGNGFAFGASCGAGGGAVTDIVFNAVDGWNLTNIVVYSLWHDFGRDGQFYNVSYSTLAAPATFLPLASVVYNPFVPQDGTDSGNRVSIAPPAGQTTFGTNIAAVKFDFTPQGSQDFGWSGYSEIVLQGTSLPPRVRFDGSYVSGGDLILTGVGAPGESYAVLTSTNVLAPIATWTTNVIGLVDGNGVISNAIPISVSEPARFFRLKTP